MSDYFNPHDWYWRRDDGAVWSSKLGGLLEKDETCPALWTRWPAEEDGTQSDEALTAVLNTHGLKGPSDNAATGKTQKAKA